MTIPRVLVIAGSDSGGGAGIQADVKTITMFGGHAMTAVTAITAQNTAGVQRVMPVPTDMVLAQLDSVASDLGFDVVKIGMLGSAATAAAVADWLARWRAPVVFDPVMVATSGAALADAATMAGFRALMRRATLVTPNLPEAAALGGEAALARSGAAVLMKGGHGEGDEVVDTLILPGGARHEWRGPRIPTNDHHGTGCTLASAVATGIGAGLALPEAVGRGIAYVRRALAHAPALGHGHGPIGHALGAVPVDLIAS